MSLLRLLPLCLLLFAGLARAAENRPNVILMMADDFGYECVTANGGESYRTPNLDRLAASGVRFEQCHVQPLCTPTRVQLMTGLYNVRNYSHFGTLPRTETTFGTLFQQAGYATGICGKWQLGHELDSPQHFGFQESYLWQHTRRPPRYANPGLEHNGKELDFKTGEYGPELVNKFALDFITRHREQPFFLYYPMILTHSPFQPTPDSPNWDPTAMGESVNQQNRHFADMTEYMDRMIGQVDAHLGKLGLRDNTLLIFIGDNGTGRGINSRLNGEKYPGGKGSTTARGTHVPLIVSWPSVIREARVNRDLISSTDLLPTICEAAGIPIPTRTDGVSFLPQLRGEPGSPREWLYCWYSPRQKVDLTVKECAFDHHYKLYRTGELFDLTADLDEKSPLDRNTLKPEAAAAARRLQAALDQFTQARPERLDREFEQTGPPATGRPKKGGRNK